MSAALVELNPEERSVGQKTRFVTTAVLSFSSRMEQIRSRLAVLFRLLVGH